MGSHGFLSIGESLKTAQSWWFLQTDVFKKFSMFPKNSGNVKTRHQQEKIREVVSLYVYIYPPYISLYLMSYIISFCLFPIGQPGVITRRARPSSFRVAPRNTNSTLSAASA